MNVLRRIDRCARSFHERATIHFLRSVLVVSATEETDSIRTMEMRTREPIQVIEFQEPSLDAPAAPRVGEGAAPGVALEDLALDGVGNVTRIR
jgi:hypothetical protein